MSDDVPVPVTQADANAPLGSRSLVLLGGIVSIPLLFSPFWYIWIVIGVILVPIVFVRSAKQLAAMREAAGCATKEDWKSFVLGLPENQKALDAAAEQQRQREAAEAAARIAAIQKEALSRPHYELTEMSAHPNVEVVGEFFREEACEAVLGGMPLNVERERQLPAHLIPEVGNVHDANAVMIWMDGHHVGYLSREDAVTYRSTLSEISDAGYLPTTAGSLWGVTRRQRDGDLRKHIYARVALGATTELRIPTNDPPRTPYSLLPWGTALQVTKEDDHLAELTEHLHGPESLAIATLHPASRTLKNGSARDFLEVRIDGDPIGELTPGSSAKLAPAVTHLRDLGYETAVWAKVKGSPLAIEVVVQAARAHEIESTWFSSLPHTIPALGRTPRSRPEVQRTREREENWDF